MIIYKFLKYPFFGKFMLDWKNPLSEIERKSWKKISVESKSGGLIEGLFATSKTNKVKATIVLGHPMGKEAKGYFLKRGYTDLLRENGFNVVVFDINGFGESTHGNFYYFEDIISIGIKAKELSPDLPIGYHGISMGGMWAIISFASEEHVYDFAIIESAATSLEKFWIHFPIASKVLKIMNILMSKTKAKIEMIERIKEAKRLNSLLLVYSKRDKWIPVSMGEEFRKNSPIPTELFVVQKARHAEIMKSHDRESYRHKIINFYNEEIHKMKTKL